VMRQPTDSLVQKRRNIGGDRSRRHRSQGRCRLRSRLRGHRRCPTTTAVDNATPAVKARVLQGAEEFCIHVPRSRQNEDMHARSRAQVAAATNVQWSPAATSTIPFPDRYSRDTRPMSVAVDLVNVHVMTKTPPLGSWVAKVDGGIPSDGGSAMHGSELSWPPNGLQVWRRTRPGWYQVPWFKTVCFVRLDRVAYLVL